MKPIFKKYSLDIHLTQLGQDKDLLRRIVYDQRKALVDVEAVFLPAEGWKSVQWLVTPSELVELNLYPRSYWQTLAYVAIRDGWFS